MGSIHTSGKSVLLIDFGSKRNAKLAHLLRRRGHRVTVVQPCTHAAPSNYDTVVFSGASRGMPRANEASLYFQIISQTLAVEKPILGICYGCQIVHTSHGGRLFSLWRRIDSRKMVRYGDRRSIASFKHRYAATDATGATAIAWDWKGPVAHKVGLHVAAQFHIIDSDPALQHFILRQVGL